VKQKARPALIISNHSIKRRFEDVILVAITSQRISKTTLTEISIKEKTDTFTRSGLGKTSVVRCEFIMTVPKELIARKLGNLPKEMLDKVDRVLKLSIGLQ
jgi:mRNA interferase MazF